MPVGARVQQGTPDRHLTIVDLDGISGFHKPDYEYDFYQVQQDEVPANGSISVTSEGSLDLAHGSGQTESVDNVLGNTNAAGFGNLAGRIRIEELEAGHIDHALSIAVPCTQNAHVWPARQSAVPPSCNTVDGPWPRMGELFWLDLDADGLARDSTSGKAPGWARTVMLAMHEHGAYVNDNGGLGSAFFQLQTEAQSQYTSLGFPDRWLDFANENWAPGANEDFVGNLQGSPPSDAGQRTAYYEAWQEFWRAHLHVIDACALPGATCG